MKSNKWNTKYHVHSSMENDKNGYAMFLGRWQPLHAGHKQLFNQSLDNGHKICIMIRDTPVSDKNPYTSDEVKHTIETEYESLVADGTVVVMVVPNITSINFGRGVGYDIIEHQPPEEVASISATKIRNNEINPDGSKN